MNLRLIRWFTLILFTIHIPFVAAQQAIQPLPDNVSLYQLDNGMQVLLIENPALPMIGVNVVVKVGSAYETFSTSGMSHMLEHLLFNGTTSRTQKQLYDDVDRIGAYNNANTSEFYTNFMMVAPAEHIKEAMEIQADMLFHSTIPAAKFQKEKGIVLEEIAKSLARPSEQLDRNQRALIFQGHALSLPTLGTYATIAAMDRVQVMDFYLNYYVPNNMLLSAIGNFKSADMLKWINEIYGKQAPGNVLLEHPANWSLAWDERYWIPPFNGQVFHRFYDGKQTHVQLIYYLPQSSPELYELVDYKLEQWTPLLQEQLGTPPQISLSTRFSPLGGYLEVDLTFPQPLPDYQEIAKRVTQFLKKQSFILNQEELNTIIQQARTAFLKNIEKPHMFGIYNAENIALFGFEHVLASYGKEGYLRAAEQLAEIEVQEPVIIIQSPAKNKKKTAQARQRLTVFPGERGAATLIVKQNSANPLIAIHYLLKHKAPLQAKYGKKAAQVLHECFRLRLQSGENQIQSAQFGISLTVNDNPFIPMDDIYLHPDFGYLRVEAPNDRLPELIAFINSQMLNFTPTQEEFQKALAYVKRFEFMTGRQNAAKTLFQDLVTNTVYQPIPKPAEKPLTYKDLLNFAAEYFRPANMIISVVSSADPQTIKDLFSSFKGKAWDQEPQPVTEKIRLHDHPITINKTGAGPQAYLFWGFSAAIDSADRAPLKALSLLLGDTIVFQIREKQGMAYHMSAGIELNDDRALFYIKQPTRPQNVEILLKQYPTFFTPQVVDQLNEQKLQKAVNMYLGRMMLRRLSSINQGFYSGYSYYFHGDCRADARFLAQLKKVTLQDVRRVANKYLHVTNPIQIVVR